MDERLLPAKTLFTIYVWLLASILYCSLAANECLQGLMFIWAIGALIVHCQYRRLKHRRRSHSVERDAD